MLQFLASQLIGNTASSLIDNLVRDRVDEPAIGSVVYCDLAFGLAEHSGIYIGDGRIVHLTRHGIVERCTPDEFIAGSPAMSIYVSCIDGRPVGSADAARRAVEFADKDGWRDYNVVLNNCHMFSEWCLTGEENSSTFLTFLKLACERHLGANAWRVWDRNAPRGAAPAATLDQLRHMLREQGEICRQHRELVNRKVKEYNRHGDNNPASTTFGGFLYESKARAWDEKDRQLRGELDSLERIMDAEDNKWNALAARVERLEGVPDAR